MIYCVQWGESVKNLIRKHRDIIVYLIFGVLTTAVNYCVYLPLFNVLHLSAAVCNIIAWLAAVAFAFVTNKPIVFKSHDWSAKTVIPELLKFTGCRVLSGAAETLILFLAVDLFSWDGNLWKFITSVFVVVANYVGSKLLVFRNK